MVIFIQFFLPKLRVLCSILHIQVENFHISTKFFRTSAYKSVEIINSFVKCNVKFHGLLDDLWMKLENMTFEKCTSSKNDILYKVYWHAKFFWYSISCKQAESIWIIHLSSIQRQTPLSLWQNHFSLFRNILQCPSLSHKFHNRWVIKIVTIISLSNNDVLYSLLFLQKSNNLMKMTYASETAKISLV